MTDTQTLLSADARALFDTVLVANRGEIARRVIRTLRRLGIRSAAVYSDADEHAPHVAEADVAVRLGPAPAAQSYLDIGRVIDAARACGAQAIHPGYGFLSESVEFAAACDAAGIVFIGPPAEAVRVMGDKSRAKAHVSASGVPVVPGFDAVGLTDDEILREAARVGFPLLVKPAAGGGGKGMTEVADEASLPEALRTARRIARASFGDDTLLLERLIARPRHIEVQVLADAHGRIVHLGERECTLQRRHQKVIEEAPSPVVTPDIRARLGEAACRAAASVDYRGVGTVEFLVSDDAPEEFFFIEMNTRLQVEHPVTEQVTGLDLVELQVRVAAGEPLGFAQQDVRLRGHAIEARVYAEVPRTGFLPDTGTVLRWTAPRGERVDAAIEDGSEVTAEYDPMIAKVIATAPDRDEALRRLSTALASTVLFGVESNLGFLVDLLGDDDVRAGRLDTGLIARRGVAADPEPPAAVLAAAARAAAPPAGPLWRRRDGWRMCAPARAPRRSLLTASGHVIEATESDDRAGDSVDVLLDGTTVWAHSAAGTWKFTALDRAEARMLRDGERAAAERGFDPLLTAPMPGTVTAVHVSDGDVAEGDRIVTIEAMKMEHPVVAPAAGRVRAEVAAGDQVRRGQVVARFEADGDDAAAGGE